MGTVKLTDKELDNIRKKFGPKTAAAVGGGLILGVGGGSVLNIAAVKSTLSNNSPNTRLNKKLESLATDKIGKGVKYLDYNLIQGPAYLADKNSDTITLINTKGANQALLAHELGHAIHHHGGKLSSKIQEKGSNLGQRYITKDAMTHNLFNAAIGAKLGYDDAILKYQGRKAGLGNKLGKVALIAGSAIPLTFIAPEVAASSKGMKLLKQAGATKQELNSARKTLIKAGSSYATAYGMAGLTALVSYLLGKRMGKKAIIQTMKNKYPELTDKQIEDIYKKEKLKSKVKNRK